MKNLRTVILATVGYYDTLGCPLTPVQIYRYLINPTRLDPLAQGVEELTLHEVVQELDVLATGGKLDEVHGYYGLPGKGEDLYCRRIERQNVGAEKWKKLLRLARWFQAVPYVRALFVSGSLAIDNSGKRGDFDMLVVMRAGRMFTGRLVLYLAASMLGVRRKRHDRVAPDKFCFNHFITDDALAIVHESIFTAYTYATLVPIYSVGDTVERFFTQNLWINKFVYRIRPSLYSRRKRVESSRWLQWVARTGERFLAGSVGDLLERVARKYQQKRINANPLTHAPAGRIINNDKELEFHPHSSEPAIIATFNKHLHAIGVGPAINEPDSGLQA